MGVACDEIRLNSNWYIIWQSADLSQLHKIIPDYQYVIFPPTLRTVSEHKSFVPWHQDYAYIQAMGKRAHSKVVTCFVPLDDQPSIRPSVEFVINPSQAIVKHEKRFDNKINQFDLPTEVINQLEQKMHYQLELGDTIFFGQLVLHRTWFPNDHFPPRNSAEFRLTKHSCLLPSKDYYSLDKQEFIKTSD